MKPTPLSTARTLPAALAYIARGLPVFPLHTPMLNGVCDCLVDSCGSNNGKHPRTSRDTKKGLLEATTDEARIRYWWDVWPHANIGLRTGELEPGVYLAVLDVDPRHGGDDTLADLLKTHGPLPETPCVITGSGGMHYYFKGPQPVKTTSAALGPGLDTRGGNEKGGAGYVVAPPSIHLSMRRYEWELSSPKVFAAPPAWLLAAGASKPALARGTPTMSEGERIGDGQEGGTGRKQYLHSIGRGMRTRGCDAEEIYAALTAINARRCDPPLEDRDVQRMAEHAARVAPGRSPEVEEHLAQRRAMLAPDGHATQEAPAPAEEAHDPWPHLHPWLCGTFPGPTTESDLRAGITYVLEDDADVDRAFAALHATGLVVEDREGVWRVLTAEERECDLALDAGEESLVRVLGTAATRAWLASPVYQSVTPRTRALWSLLRAMVGAEGTVSADDLVDALNAAPGGWTAWKRLRELGAEARAEGTRWVLPPAPSNEPAVAEQT